MRQPTLSTDVPQPTLPHTDVRPRYRLWHRESRRHKWRVVAEADRGSTALEAMDAYHGGEWMLIDDGHDPNEKGQ
jgi:hypothetical protein